MAYQKILVAIDDSEISANVIQQAAQLAKALNSQITLVQVMTLDPVSYTHLTLPTKA